MNSFYALNIQDKYATILFVKKKKKTFDVIEHETVELSELTQLLKNKKNYYLSVEQSEVINEKISIEAVIKNDNVIRNIILRKLYETRPNKKILFNYHPLPQNPNSEKTTYQIDGVYEDEYLHSLEIVGDYEEIKSATINKFALFGISRECIKQSSYFSIHTQANKITTIAVHEDKLIFSRVNTIIANNAQARQANIVEEITQTISYMQQHFREINFSVVALSGSLSVDDTITDHIHMASRLSITVLYPNTFIHGFEGEEAQHYIFSLGSFFVSKKFQFMPTPILALQQYALSLKTILMASAAALLISFFFAYDRFHSYEESLQRHKIAKDKLDRLINSTKTYSNEELKRSLAYLQMSQKYLWHHPLDIISLLKPLIIIEKPKELEWKYFNENLKVDAKFQRSFETLNELYHFEKLFFSTFEDIKTTYKKEYLVKTDYTKLYFDTSVIIENSDVDQKSTATPTTVRRRR